MIAVIVNSNKFFGKFQVLLPNGERIDCHNLATARSTAERINNER